MLTRDFLDTALGARTALLVGPGHLMTSYDMNGFSVSVLPLNDEFRQALLSKVPLAAWPGAEKTGVPAVVALPESNPEAPPPSSDPLVKGRLLAILNALKASRDKLNALDAKVGDGDAGDTFANAASAIEAKLESLPFAQPDQLLAEISRSLGHAGGSSGILLAIFTGAASVNFRQSKDWQVALEYGAQRMFVYGGAAVGDRTMLDALWPGLRALSDGKSLVEAATAARQGAQSTAEMTTARAGRSAYLNANSLTGVVDPGAEAVAVAFESLISDL